MEGGDIILTPDLGVKTPNPFVDFIKKSWLIILDIILVLLIITLFTLKSLKSATLDILITPISANVIINGKTYTNGAYKFYPGTITAEITKDDFTTKKVTLNLEENTTTRLYDFLTADDDFSYYYDHAEDLELLKIVGKNSEPVRDFLTKYIDQENLRDFLPIIHTESSADISSTISYSISYETSKCKKNPYCILISSNSPDNYPAAISLFKKYGYNPSDYEIIYE